MKIKVNGEEKVLNTNTKKITLTKTIELLGYQPNTIVGIALAVLVLLGIYIKLLYIYE